MVATRVSPTAEVRLQRYRAFIHEIAQGDHVELINAIENGTVNYNAVMLGGFPVQSLSEEPEDPFS